MDSQWNPLLNKVFIISEVLRHLAKYFCKHEAFLQRIIAIMKV